jgi:hypothetical protein
LFLSKRCSIASFDELLQRPLFDCFSRQDSVEATVRLPLLKLPEAVFQLITLELDALLLKPLIDPLLTLDSKSSFDELC